MKQVTTVMKGVVAISVATMMTTGVAVASSDTERSVRGPHKISEVDRDIQRHQWFSAMDANNDGYISEDEFVAAAVTRAEEGARKVFAHMDSESTGEISAEQFNALAEERSARFAERRESMRERAKSWRAKAHEQRGDEGQRKERRRDRGSRGE